VESRIRNALALYTYALLGIFLVVVPWTPVWAEAVRALAPSPLAGSLASGWARGVASAVGVLDLLVALQLVRAVWRDGAQKNGGAEAPPSS
jgi:hypothetical protein